MDDRADTTLEAGMPDDASLRRRLISALLAGGIAAVAAPLALNRASASTGGADPADHPGLNAALERESRIAATYASALAGVSGAENVAALTLVHDHHVAYAQSLKGYLGNDAIDPDRSPLAAIDGTSALSAVAKQLASLEEQILDANLSTLAALRTAGAATLLSSIITVEGRHVAALLILGGAAPAVAAGI